MNLEQLKTALADPDFKFEDFDKLEDALGGSTESELWEIYYARTEDGYLEQLQETAEAILEEHYGARECSQCPTLTSTDRGGQFHNDELLCPECYEVKDDFYDFDGP